MLSHLAGGLLTIFEHAPQQTAESGVASDPDVVELPVNPPMTPALHTMRPPTPLAQHATAEEAEADDAASHGVEDVGGSMESAFQSDEEHTVAGGDDDAGAQIGGKRRKVMGQD
jgi:hypothetical protein